MTSLLIILRGLLALLCSMGALSGQAAAQTAAGATDSQAPLIARRVPGQANVDRLNAWTLGLAGGQLEGAPIRFATEIARVVDDGENLHVLPIVTRGPAEYVEALLYLRDVDAVIISVNALEQFKALEGPGFHPAWKNVRLNAKVPLLTGFPAAQEWLDAAANRPPAPQAGGEAASLLCAARPPDRHRGIFI